MKLVWKFHPVFICAGLIWVLGATPGCSHSLGQKETLKKSVSPLPQKKVEHIKRYVLGLYDSSEKTAQDNNEIHNQAEMVLNHLGLMVRYHDIHKGLPPPEKLRGVRGILTWFQDDQMKGAQAYGAWVKEQCFNGLRYVMLEQYGAMRERGTQTPLPKKMLNSVFGALGFTYLEGDTDNPLLVEVVTKDSAMVEFERNFSNERLQFTPIVPLSSEVVPHLVVQRKDDPSSLGVMVATGKKGGWALGNYVVYRDPALQKRQWFLNPFLFFEMAFGVGKTPRFDTTTAMGRRIFYSHIDGDGLRNISEVDRKSSSGKVVFEQVLKKYRWPVTVSVITAEVDPKYIGNPTFFQWCHNACKFQS